jgi:hypothetical protein
MRYQLGLTWVGALVFFGLCASGVRAQCFYGPPLVACSPCCPCPPVTSCCPSECGQEAVACYYFIPSFPIPCPRPCPGIEPHNGHAQADRRSVPCVASVDGQPSGADATRGNYVANYARQISPYATAGQMRGISSEPSTAVNVDHIAASPNPPQKVQPGRTDQLPPARVRPTFSMAIRQK